MKPIHYKILTAALLGCLACSAHPARAQAAGTSTSTTTASTPGESAADKAAAKKEAAKPVTPGASETKMETIVVNAPPPEQNIMPTSRPFNSQFGLDLNVMDTPRNVTIISREQLSDSHITSVRDFTKLTSSSYTRSNFGAPTTPDIRGQSADVLLNGMREGLTSNGNGLPLNFNSVESVNIGKGPPAVNIGASQYQGGYVDLVTKRPFFDKFHGEVSTENGSYDYHTWTLDFGAPIIKDQLAYRVSYTGVESEGWTEDAKQHIQAIYTALSWLPSDIVTVDFNNEFATYNYTENWGLNRPTQGLIDNGQYQTGVVSPGQFGVTGGGPNLVTLGPTVPVDYRARLHNPADGSNGTSDRAQSIVTANIDDDFQIVDNGLFQYINRNTRSSYLYDEVLKDDVAYENRLEFHLKQEIPIIAASETSTTKNKLQTSSITEPGLTFNNQINTGLDYRFQHVNNYDNYSSEPVNAWDLNQNSKQIALADQNQTFAGFGTFQIPGEPAGYTFSPRNGDNNNSTAHQVGIFFEDVLKFTDQWSLLFGVRADNYFVSSDDPDGTPPSYFSTTDFATFNRQNSSTEQTLVNANVSPTFKPFPWMTLYTTYNYSQYTGVANGGGYAPEFQSADYHRQSELFEGGMKVTLLKDTLFASLTGYNQNRQAPTIGGNAVTQEVRGIEAEMNWQPDKHFYMTMSYSYTDSVTRDPGFVANLVPIDQAHPIAGVVDTSTFNTFNPSGGGSQVLTGDYRTPGIPHSVFNTLFTYRTDFGLGATFGVVVTDEYNLSYNGGQAYAYGFAGATQTAQSAIVPVQLTADLTVFYEQPHYTLALAFLNLSDERNFSPVNQVYGNGSVAVDPGLQIQGTLKFRF